MIEYFDAVGFEGLFQISRCGSVRSKSRRIKNYPKGTRVIKGKLIKGTTTKAGYKLVESKANGKRTLEYIHRLVYKTFVGEIPDGMTIDHINGEKLDNRVENLDLVTQSENSKRAWKVGLCDGVKTPVICEVEGFGIWFPYMRMAKFANPSLIHATIHGRQSTHRGMKWHYAPIKQQNA